MYFGGKPNIEGGTFLLNKEGGLVNWDPVTREVPKVAFVFVTSSKKKAEGLHASWRDNTTFGNWSPSKPPVEPNHLPLNKLIRVKARDLTLETVRELRQNYFMDEALIPNLFLVTDTHPSLSKPGYSGEVHLVKPEADISFDGLVNGIADTWTRFSGPVDVQIASAYVMTNKKGRIVTSQPIQDSVFIHYPDNPLKNERLIREYLQYLKDNRFPGLRESEFVSEVTKVAGAIFNELLYPFAYERGIEGVISHALRSTYEPNVDSIVAMGAAALTPAIVGWIEQRARGNG